MISGYAIGLINMVAAAVLLAWWLLRTKDSWAGALITSGYFMGVFYITMFTGVL